MEDYKLEIDVTSSTRWIQELKSTTDQKATLVTGMCHRTQAGSERNQNFRITPKSLVWVPEIVVASGIISRDIFKKQL